MNQYLVELLPLSCCTVVVLTAACWRESTLSILSWHPVPRVAFACIPSVALGNLEVTAPAREPSLVTLISQTPCYYICKFPFLSFMSSLFTSLSSLFPFL